MKNVIARKEKYGFLVYSPVMQCYYRINDEILSSLILDIYNCTNIDNTKHRFLELFPLEYKLLGIEDHKVLLIDNSKMNPNVFVPLEAYFDYTARCNKSCDYCYNKKHLSSVTMPSDIVRKVFDDFYELGIMRIHLAGGEPTIDYDGIKNYIEYSRKLGMTVSMATNGTLLDDKMCELLTSNDLLSVSFSIDSADEKNNDLRRGEGTYKKLLDGVKKL